MAEKSQDPDNGRCCFVTVGATSSFPELVEAVLESSFLHTLAGMGYSQLRLQYGKDGGAVVSKALGVSSALPEQLETPEGVSIVAFEYKTEGVTADMTLARGKGQREGVVISHAGSGSILEAMRLDAPLIVVPNSSLLHNHQQDLAEELSEQGYVIHGQLKNLSAALSDIEILRQRKVQWPPRSTNTDPTGRGLIGILDEEMGFVD